MLGRSCSWSVGPRHKTDYGLLSVRVLVTGLAGLKVADCSDLNKDSRLVVCLWSRRQLQKLLNTSCRHRERQRESC